MGSIMKMYSVSKLFTSVAVMQLVERGMLSLEDSAWNCVPDSVAMVVQEGSNAPRPASAKPTIRQCLQHTSGLSYRGNPLVHHPKVTLPQERPKRSSDPVRTLADVARQDTATPLMFEPGTRFNYGVGHAVAGRAVEVASGTGIEEYLQRNIHEPLGMMDTG